MINIKKEVIYINLYKDVLDQMTFSFSRLTTYERCPYCFYLTYIKKVDKNQNAFAEYGTFCHELLEKYFKNELMIFELLNEYNDKFTQNVIHDFPPNKYVDLACSYFKQGQDYFTNFDGLPQYKIIDAERKVEFNIDKYPFIGYIDLIVENKDRDIEIVDHKSKDLSKVQKKRWNDIEIRRTTELYEYLRQLYIYSIPIIEQEKITPKYLNFNCFRKPSKSRKVNWIQIPFDIDDYNESKKWAYNIIKDIYKDEDMNKTYNNDWFCNQLCSVKEYCPKSNRYIGNVV